MGNPTLFDLTDGPDRFNGAVAPRNPCTPARVGSGPGGEACGGCAHRRRCRTRAGNTFQKCWKMEHAWTHGGATDIKVAWSACSEWVKRTGDVTEIGI